MENELDISSFYGFDISDPDKVVFEFLPPSGFNGVKVMILDITQTDDPSILALTYDVIYVPDGEYQSMDDDKKIQFESMLCKISTDLIYKAAKCAIDNAEPVK